MCHSQERFNEYLNWLEYSISKDILYRLCCYLFKLEVGDQSVRDHFVGVGFSNSKKKDKLQTHVGGPNSVQNQIWGKCESFLNKKQQVVTFFNKMSNLARINYQIRLGEKIDCTQFLLQQGLTFHGHDETKDLKNQGNFLELLSGYATIIKILKPFL